MVEVHHHRAGALKQQNKRFKSKHATKSSLKDIAKGRIQHQSSTSGPASSTAAQARLNRRNNAKQAQSQKRHALTASRRIFSGVNGAPRIVAVVPLTEDIDTPRVISLLGESLESSWDDFSKNGLLTVKVDRFKTSLQFINVPYRSVYAALDACKTADYVVFALSSTVEVNNEGDVLLRLLQAQGLPEVVTVVSPNDSLDSKLRSTTMKSLLSFIQYFVPTQTRVFDLQASFDRLNAVRAVSESLPGGPRWRDGRTWVLGENTEWDNGTLKITGVVRGAALSANRLVHIPNFGDFRISKILSAPVPQVSKSGISIGMDIEPAVLAECDPSSADSLVSTNDPDDLANEQTWPTEEEMQVTEHAPQAPGMLPDAKAGTTPKTVKRIPKGMSEYQAAWIIDSDDEDEGSEVDEKKMEMENIEEELHDVAPAEEDHDMETEGRQSVTFQDLDVEEEAKQLAAWRDREREEENDVAFPDELDTPKDIPARVRFQRFRGLKSFRTSPWDPYENLPRDYARIFQFEDFKRTERGVRRRAEEEGIVQPGVRVTVHVSGVPAEVVGQSPIALFSLFKHEHKVSVLNFTVQRNTEYDGLIKSKDPLILCVGPRRLFVNPIFSQHTHGGGKGANNVLKFERFLRRGVTSVATIYGPIIFGKQPCVLLRESLGSPVPQLVAMGTFLNTDTTRVIAKRVILTGHPFKVHKKTSTVRYMFFNKEDVQYFKPIQLHTKYGRSGHIRESLGTHGYFKAHFDGPVSQMDTVCMSLYKRVFPRWYVLWKGPGVDQNIPSDAMESEGHGAHT